MCRMTDKEVLRLEQRDGEWVLAGEHAARFGLVDEYLAHLLDRNYSPATVRSYGYDLLAFCRRPPETVPLPWPRSLQVFFSLFFLLFRRKSGLCLVFCRCSGALFTTLPIYHFTELM